ncbi:predicted protein [Sclerotinia sclerotiorum 1980 UF-70]|uniref:Uncharacterized protein n=1 Tax=Sclerotinia sclerotiorum (strain ATCC 18683 / 1980 / Ss-1) TaxID=665079 RepID=A7ELJ0_SCLS1|nr:predicted protein [Sclerotinia sclerotiorum 1980 UF-70]EDO03706.1 predicted protein [Sclerotinia sclerotiorum 1980 UF-70]
MDALEWSCSNLAVRNKEPIVTVREILQDSDVEEQTAEPSSSHSPRKRSHCEVEKNSYFTPSIREAITTTSKKGKERIPDTASFGRRFGSSELAQPELSISPASPSKYSKLESSTTVLENSKSHNFPNTPELFQSKTHNLEKSYKSVSHGTSQGPSSKVRGPENKCGDIPNDKEAENDYEFISNTFESLHPLVEDWINQQRSQLDTVTERINRILGCLLQGERLQQEDPTIEMTSQLKDLIDEITNEITTDSSINDSKPRQRYCQQQRHFVNQLRAVFMTTDAYLCLKELVKLADIRSTMIGLAEKEVEFIDTIEQLNTSHRKAMKELHMLKPKDTIEYSTNHREYTNLSKMIMALKEEMSGFYKY